MSRIEKRMHQEAILAGAPGADDNSTSVRLFAFTNLIKGYRPQFSPAKPIIVLKSRRGAVEQHPCAQWVPFATEVFQKHQRWDGCVFVVDATSLPSQLEQEEDVSPLLAGPVLKRSSNVIGRLNCEGATLVAAGASTQLAMKIVLLSDKQTNSRGQTLVTKLVLASPRDADACLRLVRHVVKHVPAVCHSKIDRHLVLLVSDGADLSAWQAFTLNEDVRRVFVGGAEIVTKCQPLFEVLTASCMDADDHATAHPDGDDESYRFRKDPMLFQIRFLLSRYTKQVEQEAEPSLIEDWSGSRSIAGQEENSTHDASSKEGGPRSVHRDPRDETSDKEVGSIGIAGPPPAHGLQLNELSFVRGESCVFDAFVLDADTGVVGSNQGVVSVTTASRTFLPPTGSAIRVTATVKRSLMGKTTVDIAAPVAPLSVDEVKQSASLSSVKSVAQWLHHSKISRGFGLLVIRGKKCVLVRSLSGEYRGMRLPYQLHDDSSQSCLECAMEAACMQCDVSEDNFVMHPFIAPVMYYATSTTCITIYVAIAAYPPDDDESEEDREELGDPYDWLSYEGARSRLSTTAERVALDQLKNNLQVASQAGMYVPQHGLGLFGSSDTATTTMMSKPTSTGVNNDVTSSLRGGGGDGDGIPVTDIVVVHRCVVAAPVAAASSSPSLIREDFCRAFRIDKEKYDDIVYEAHSMDVPTVDGTDSEAGVLDPFKRWFERRSSLKNQPAHQLFVFVSNDNNAKSTSAWLSLFSERSGACALSSSTDATTTTSPDTSPADLDMLGLFEKQNKARFSLVEHVVCDAMSNYALLTRPSAVKVSGSCHVDAHIDFVRHLIIGCRLADRIVIEGPESSKMAVEFVSLITQGRTPLLSDWSDASESLIDSTVVDKAEHFLVIEYQRGLPFAPKRFAELLSSTTTLSEPSGGESPLAVVMHDVPIVWIEGYCWLSTRFAYRGQVSLTSAGGGPRFQIEQGDPWWCLMEEADRPASVDPSTWDGRHGDRGQSLTCIVSRDAAPSLTAEAALKAIEAMLDPMLCRAEEWRTWQRLPDPLEVWEA